jgi:hypothetical protein
MDNGRKYMKFNGLVLAGLFTLVSVAAQAEPTQATLTTDSTTGSVKYRLPGATTFKDLGWEATVKIPNGTVVKTTKDGIAQIEVFPGGKVVVMPNATFTVSNLDVETQGDKVTKRSGKIDLADGTLKALLSHKGQNTSPIDFSVKTPTCVAAARGTKYVVAEVGGVTYVEVIEGTVTAGGISIGPGQVGAVGGTGVGTLIGVSDLSPDVVAALNAAVAIEVNGTPTINTSDSSIQSAH